MKYVFLIENLGCYCQPTSRKQYYFEDYKKVMLRSCKVRNHLLNHDFKIKIICFNSWEAECKAITVTCVSTLTEYMYTIYLSLVELITRKKC